MARDEFGLIVTEQEKKDRWREIAEKMTVLEAREIILHSNEIEVYTPQLMDEINAASLVLKENRIWVTPLSKSAPRDSELTQEQALRRWKGYSTMGLIGRADNLYERYHLNDPLHPKE